MSATSIVLFAILAALAIVKLSHIAVAVVWFVRDVVETEASGSLQQLPPASPDVAARQ